MKGLKDVPFTREDFDSIVDPAATQEAKYESFCSNCVLTDAGTLKYVGTNIPLLIRLCQYGADSNTASTHEQRGPSPTEIKREETTQDERSQFPAALGHMEDTMRAYDLRITRLEQRLSAIAPTRRERARRRERSPFPAESRMFGDSRERSRSPGPHRGFGVPGRFQQRNHRRGNPTDWNARGHWHTSMPRSEIGADRPARFQSSDSFLMNESLVHGSDQVMPTAGGPAWPVAPSGQSTTGASGLRRSEDPEQAERGSGNHEQSERGFGNP